MENNGGHLKKLAAGLFFIAGLGLIAVSVFFIGLDRGLTEPKFQVIALFHQVGGLAEGSPIRISGVNVGVVGAVDFLNQPIEGHSLKVRMDIFKKYEFEFRKCSKVSIKTLRQRSNHWRFFMFSGWQHSPRAIVIIIHYWQPDA